MSEPSKSFCPALPLRQLPQASLYQKSYMHKQTITSLAASTKTDFLTTGSSDGVIKIWKKIYEGIQEVKEIKAHLKSVLSMRFSRNGRNMASIGQDQPSVKIFDILAYDMACIVKIDFNPLSIEFIEPSNSTFYQLAVSATKTIVINDIQQTRQLDIHQFEVKFKVYNEIYQSVVSVDSKGIFEYWNSSGSLPEVEFRYKTETDLFVYMAQQIQVWSLSMAPSGDKFAVFGSDRLIRIFQYLTGKVTNIINQTFQHYQSLQTISNSLFRLQRSQYQRRIQLEYQMDPISLNECLKFDLSGDFLCFSSYIGIQVFEHTGELARILGRPQKERFTNILVFQGRPLKNLTGKAGTGGSSSQGKKISDPTIFSTSHRKNRFFLFTSRDPSQKQVQTSFRLRDIANQRQISHKKYINQLKLPSRLAHTAIIHTTMGDITISLQKELCPKTVQNFTMLSLQGYYDQLIFHRVMKNFMIQTGDPQGDGTGGTSIWNCHFADQIHQTLTHSKPFCVSMANKGPNTNGSQFFITTVAAPWLDGSHTLFGHVKQGMEVVAIIESVPVDKNRKPKADVRIISVDVLE